MTLLEKYESLMRRSRWLGMVGAGLVLLPVAIEFSALYVGALQAENLRVLHIVQSVMVLLTVAVSLVVRVLILRQGRRYRSQVASWIACAGTLIFYCWWNMPTSSSVCNEQGVCFEIYDMRDMTDWVTLTAPLFFLLSALRAAITLGCAAFRQQYR